jgi:hypothetical protein
MLHTETVQSELLDLLSAIMSELLFDQFRLVGGTSLALQIGHRQSIDIDLFGDQELEEYTLRELIGFYKTKYQDGSEFLVLKSLSYFDDAEIQADPIMLVEYSWSNIKDVILEATRKYVI